MCERKDMSKTYDNGYAGEKNEQNLSLYQYITNTITTAINTIPSLLPGWYFSPDVYTYSQGPLSSGTTYTEYTFTVPAKCQYIKVLLIGAGGHGGSEDPQFSFLSWSGGGGGAGAWGRLLIQKSQFTAGTTQYKVRVGHAANASAVWQDAKGGDTSFLSSGGTVYATAFGGDSAANNQFEGQGGTGGTFSQTAYYLENARGQNGSDAQHHYQSLLVTDKVISGMGGTHSYGSAGTSVVKGTGMFDPGRPAVGYGAGGSGAVHMNNIPGNPTLYGGNGAGGYACIEFYYQ